MGNLTKDNYLHRIFGALKNGGAEARMGILIHLLSPFTQLLDEIFENKRGRYINVKPVFAGPD